MNFDATRVISPQEVGPTLTVTLFLTVSFHSSHDYYTINIKSKLNVLYDHMTSQQQNFVNEQLYLWNTWCIASLLMSTTWRVLVEHTLYAK